LTGRTIPADAAAHGMIHLVRPGEGMLGTFRLLATGEHTSGAYFALELEGLPGGPGGAHSHDFEDEAEYVSIGSREIRVDDELVHAPTGSFVLVPRGSLHDMWTVGSASARYLHLFSPAGIEQWFLERARLRDRGASAEQIDAARLSHGVRGERTSPPDARPQVAISREGQALVIDGSMTGGAYAIVEIVSTPGDPPTPPHVHVDAEEAIYVASGEISITAADETYAAPAGTFALVPRGTVHSHSHCGKGPARVLLIGSPPAGIGAQPERAVRELQ